jgi:anti-anti-sigma regulatory factor
MAQTAAGRVEVGTSGDRVLVRVSGRATHAISQPLRDFGKEMMHRGYRSFEVDLCTALHLDSTFAGVLAGLSLKLKQLGGTMTLINTPARCIELLATLGIEKLFPRGEPKSAEGPANDAPPLTSLPLAARSLEAWAGTVIEAHQLLVKADDRNEARFRDLLQLLEEEVGGPALPIAARMPEQRVRRWKH